MRPQRPSGRIAVLVVAAFILLAGLALRLASDPLQDALGGAWHLPVGLSLPRLPLRCDTDVILQQQHNLTVYGADPERNLTGFRAPAKYVSLQEAFFTRRSSVPLSGFPPLEAARRKGFATRFLPNDNPFDRYPLYAAENLCVEATPGSLSEQFQWVVVAAEVPPDGPAQPESEFRRMWNLLYNATDPRARLNLGERALVGARVARDGLLPEEDMEVLWVPGNTLHYQAYGSNTMHNWAERVWAQIARLAVPELSSRHGPVHHFLIGQFEHYMKRAAPGSRDQGLADQLLWQARMLMELAPPEADNLLLDGGLLLDEEVVVGLQEGTTTKKKKKQRMVCFQRVLMQPYDLDRIDYTRLPPEVYGPAVRAYRDAVLRFFGYPEAAGVRAPPERLKVVFYGRRDVRRRRVVNGEQVLAFLRNVSRPPLEVYSLDDMLAAKVTSYLFQDVLSLHSQTDIWIVAHGANTWASFLMPLGAAVIELFGPCNWSTYSPNRFFRHLSDGTGQTAVHTWTHANAVAAGLKHDLSNPWQTAVPQPGNNSTACTNARTGTPDYTVDLTRLGAIVQHLGCPAAPGDRFTQHWLYDWTQQQHCN